MDLIDVETELRSHLATRPVPRAPGDLVERTRARHRRQRRQQAAMVGVGLAVALLFGSVPVLRAVLPDPGTAEDAAAPRREPAPGIHELPPRGPLAGDADWLASVAALPWEVSEADPDTDPAVDSHRVSWAGDVAGVRFALVVGQDGARLAGVWFTGPAGAAPEQMTQATTVSRVQRNQPLAVVDVPAGGSTGVLVVVGLPGDTVEYVADRTVTAAGEEQVDRRPLPGADGVAAGEINAPLGPGGGVPAVVVRDGEELSSMSYTLTDRAEALALAPVEGVADPRGLRGRVAEELLQHVLRTAVRSYGTGPDAPAPVLLAAGRSGDGEDETVLVGWTFPSGAALLSIGHTEVTEGGRTTSSHTDAQPAGAALLDRVLAVPLDGDVALSGPPGAVTAEVLGADGALLGTVPLTTGSGVATIEASAVRFLAGDGAVLAAVAVRELGS